MLVAPDSIAGSHLHLASRSGRIGAMAKRKKQDARPTYENIQFVAPGGSRALYKSAAELAGANDWKTWVRETLHAAAAALHEEHDASYKDPGIHPVAPPPLQDRSKLRR